MPLQWSTPLFDVPLADKSAGGKSLVDTYYDLRYGSSPLNNDNWATATPLPSDLPVALDISGQVELELHESPYHQYNGVVASCDQTHMTVYLKFAYQPFPTICPVQRGIPGQKITFEVWQNGTKVDGNTSAIYTTRPNGKAEWISGDLTDVYFDDGGEWFTIKAIWAGGTITLIDGTVIGADPITKTMDIHRFEGYFAAPYPNTWPEYGRRLAYDSNGVQIDVQVTAGAVSGDETTVEVQEPMSLPPFQGANPAVAETPMFAVDFVQTGGAPIEELAAPVTVSATYPASLLDQSGGLGESSLRAYRYDLYGGQWLLIDPAATILDRQAHCLQFPIEHLGLIALAAETDVDGDGLGDFEETEIGTLPSVADTDEDGTSDGDEIWSRQGDPFDPLQRIGCDQHDTVDLTPPSGYCFIAARLHAGADASDVSNSVYLGPPLDVSFTESANGTGVFSADAAWGDFDGDGDPDLVLCGESDSGLVTRTFENESGALTLRQDLVGIENTGSGCLAWGDYDGDLDLDLALAGLSDSGRVTRIYTNDGDGNLTHDPSVVMTGVDGAALAWGDVDADGDLDLVVTGYGGAVNSSVLYENDGDGTLTPFAVQPLTGLRGGSADWGDLDRDGDLDLLLTGYDGSLRRTIVYTNDGTGTLTDSGDHGLCGVNLSDVDLGDFDADGDLDLAITGCTAASGPNVARIYANDGSGAFSQVAQPLNVYRSSCAWGDIDLDGDLDLALCGYTGTGLQTSIIENTEGGFAPSSFWFPGVREGSVHLVDVDVDGDLDFFMTGADWGTKYARLYRNDGLDGTTGVAPGPGDLPARQLALQGNHPNPFNPATAIRFDVPRAGEGSLRVYDLRGQLVRTLLDGRIAAGAGSVVWDGRADGGRFAGSGVYLYRLEIGGEAVAGSMTLVK